MNLGKVSLSKYISVNFTKAFMTIFLPIFFIGSLVLIITLSSITSLMQVSFMEMVRIFGYKLPLIIFYSIPVSFLVAVVITLLRLSVENELIALFALGVKSKQIMRQLWIIASLFSLLLLILSLLEMPQAKQRYKAFKSYKLTQAKVNISPSRLGQKFGDLFVYLKEKDGQKMKGIVLYTKDEDGSNRLFIAKEAEIDNLNSAITLTLKDGSGYTFDDRSLKEIDYDTMKIFHYMDSNAYNYRNVIEYWINYSYDPKRKGEILFFIFISLIPMLGLYIVASFSIINPRYQKNYAYPILALTTTALFVIATALKKDGSFLILALTLVTTSTLGWFLFRQKVSRFF
ncbi:LptF/LptG family permease [Sulfurovum sp. bin170]|uniref:LptF/LptG family permease n=1 Tax=Sulfurovum sp. bin170 TaxID=2695268 RepID=UPI0013E021D0|nr:LptF/LptG family permease [Sulfurovum sp. bin170]NEW60526.1 LptF/LptG family permease [Sulfurovum sp. bin170]